MLQNGNEIVSNEYQFKSLGESDLPIIENWLQEPHVKAGFRRIGEIDAPYGRDLLMDVMKRRFLLVDKVIFVDLPLWRHYWWWCTKRQIKSLWNPRSELVGNSNEATLSHTMKLYKILWRVHKQIRPKLLELFSENSFKEKVIRIRNLKEWNNIYNNGLSYE